MRSKNDPDLRLVANVDGAGDGASADRAGLRCDFVERRLIAAHDCDVCALGRQRQRRRAADAAATAGDDRHLAIERAHDAPPLTFTHLYGVRN